MTKTSDEEWNPQDEDLVESVNTEEERELLLEIEYQERQERKRKRKKKNSEKEKKEKDKEVVKRVTAKDFILNKSEQDFKLQTLLDLINILDHKDAGKRQKDLITALRELDNMVGMKHLKQQIMNQILFFVQDFHEPGTFLHTVITGPPGTGKTSLTYIMSKIYRSLGFLQNDKIIIADRANLIAQYLGQTAPRTKAVLDEAKGGIILIDEAYSLGSQEGRDSFSKECIDTINQYLSEHCDDLVCIIAGYREEIQKCFFNVNSGLERRFPWRFDIEKYNSEELTEILYRQLKSWTIVADREYINKKINENIEYFNGNGGDTKNLLDKCKVSHARRAFVGLSSITNDLKAISGNGTRPITVKISSTESYQNPGENGKRKRTVSNKKINKKIKINVDKQLSKEDFEKGLENYIRLKKEKTDTKEHCKYEKLFLVEYLQDSWLKKNAIRIENYMIFETYDKFMSKNRDHRPLGKVDFLKKICDIDGVKTDEKKLYILLDAPKIFECLKSQGIVSDEMQNSGKRPFQYLYS